ncbi:Os01g0511600, partial [Oryza sativa Japonica Group]
DAFAPALAKGFMDFFEPATLFIQRWLPLFYVPSLVVLPLAVRDVPAASGLKIFLIIFGGWFASLMVAGYTALTVRKIVQTQLIPAEPMSKPSPFATLEFWAWGAVFVASFAVAYVNPTALGTTARTCLPFLLASTVLGYMV